MAMAVRSITGNQGLFLNPGTYAIEVQFERPAPHDVLLAGLARAGFADVELEPASENARVGGPALATIDENRFSTKPRAPSAFAAPVRLSPTTSAPTPAPAPAASPQQMIANAVLKAAKEPDASATAALHPSATAAAKATATARVPVATATKWPQQAVAPGAPGVIQNKFTSDINRFVPAVTYPQQVGPDGRNPYAGDPYYNPSTATAPTPLTGEPYDPATSDLGSGSSSPDDSSNTFDGSAETAPSESTSAADSPDAETAKFLASLDLSHCSVVSTDPQTPMFLCIPSHATIAGSRIGAAPPFVYRFIAHVPFPLLLKNGAGSWWRRIAPIQVDAYGPAPLQVIPFGLDSGKTYDVRFFSRDKKGSSRGDIGTLLEGFGFAPDILVLRRRNVRLPRRSNLSLSEWVASGVWKGPATLLTREEPFLFADVKAAAP